MIIAEQINSGAFLFSSIYRIPSHCHHQLEASLSPSVLHQYQHPASRIPNSSSEVGVQKTPRLVVNIIIIFFVVVVVVAAVVVVAVVIIVVIVVVLVVVVVLALLFVVTNIIIIINGEFNILGCVQFAAVTKLLGSVVT